MTSSTDRILFSSTDGDFAEPTHINVRSFEYWAELFAEEGFVRNTIVDVSYISPWAGLFERSEAKLPEIVRAYELDRVRLRRERDELRSAVIKQSAEITEDAEQASLVTDQLELAKDSLASMRTEVSRLQNEILSLKEDRMRAVSAARSALTEAAEYRAQAAELGAHWHAAQRGLEAVHGLGARLAAVEESRAYKLGQAVASPTRRFRGK